MENYIYILEDTQGNREQFKEIEYDKMITKLSEINGLKLHIYRKYRTLTELMKG